MEVPTKVRCAEPRDLAAIVRIERASSTAAHWSESVYDDALRQTERLLLVAESGGAIVGFLVAAIATQEWELENIAVQPECRKRGVGRSLIRSLMERAENAGAAEIRQEIRISNLRALALGQSSGFVRQGVRKGYYRDPAEDALLLNYLVKVHKKG